MAGIIHLFHVVMGGLGLELRGVNMQISVFYNIVGMEIQMTLIAPYWGLHFYPK